MMHPLWYPLPLDPWVVALVPGRQVLPCQGADRRGSE